MSTLYPTLEDLKVHQFQQAQIKVAESAAAAQNAAATAIKPDQLVISSPDLAGIYPSLMDEYMGLKLEAPSVQQQQLLETRPGVCGSSSGVANNKQYTVVAPLTANDAGIKRGAVSQCIREVFCCKNAQGKFGLRFKDVNKGLFIQCVESGSPAALAGLRFGDQILQINGTNVAGFTCDQAFKLLSKVDAASFIMRDRPLERAITLHKDSQGNVGFTHDDGLIKAIVKDSSAARNGLLIDHHVLEVNGQNVVGMKSKQLADVIKNAGQHVTLTIMPKAVYEHIVKCMSDGLLKKFMDRSIPELY